jgi:predicted SnoaL-like aldol condensation-catalyzing enzyme
MKNWISAIAGVLLTAWMAYDLNTRFDWSGGAGQTPREFVARYLELAYTQGQGEAAAKEFLAPTAVDHVANAIDRQNGEPIPHRIDAIIADGGTVAVVHRVEAARGQSAQVVVDVYQTARGKITERRRIAQVESP